MALREGVGVESRGDGDPTAVGNDEFEVGLGGRDRRGRIGQDGDREEPAGTGDDGGIRGNHRGIGEVREEATPPSEPQTS